MQTHLEQNRDLAKLSTNIVSSGHSCIKGKILYQKENQLRIGSPDKQRQKRLREYPIL